MTSFPYSSHAPVAAPVQVQQLRRMQPPVDSTTAWGPCNVASPGTWQVQSPCMDDRRAGASCIIAEIAAGNVELRMPQGVAPPGALSAGSNSVAGPHRQWLPQAPTALARVAKEAYLRRFIESGIEPRCYGGPVSESRPFGLPDECMNLHHSIERLAATFWFHELTDFSRALIDVMAVCLAQCCMFRDQNLNHEVG